MLNSLWEKLAQQTNQSQTWICTENTSVAIASMVTANARLKLYDKIEKIENSAPGRVLYFDADSIISIHKEYEG
jgi:hypothetical protein